MTTREAAYLAARRDARSRLDRARDAMIVAGSGATEERAWNILRVAVYHGTTVAPADAHLFLVDDAARGIV